MANMGTSLRVKETVREGKEQNMSPEGESLEEENVRKNDPIDRNKLDGVDAGVV